MNYREVLIEDDKTLADSGTETFDINVTDPITELEIRFKVKNSTATADDVPAETALDKVEIIDGGQVYFSLTGEECIAAACYDTGRWPPCWYNETLSANQRANFPIRFGRYLGDTQFGFSPRKLVNPQLRVTWAKNALHLTGYVTLGIIARVMTGAPEPPQCLMWKQIEEFTSASSGVKTVNMPVDHPYRRLMTRAYITSALMSEIVSHFKLDCDVGKLLVFDLDESEMSTIVRSVFGPYTYRKVDMFDQGGRAQAWMGGDTVVSAQTNSAESFVQAYCSGWSYYDQIALKWDGTVRTDAATDVLVWGSHPHNTWCYQFGRKDEPDTWFHPTEFKTIDLKLTQALADGKVQVSFQQPRTLP